MNANVAVVQTLVQQETNLDWDDLLSRVDSARKERPMNTGKDAREMAESVDKLLLCEDVSMPISFIKEFISLSSHCREVSDGELTPSDFHVVHATQILLTAFFDCSNEESPCESAARTSEQSSSAPRVFTVEEEAALRSTLPFGKQRAPNV